MDSQEEQTIHHRFEENNLTEAINSTEQKSKKAELRGPIKDCKVNIISSKKLVKLLNLCKRHNGNLGNKI